MKKFIWRLQKLLELRIKQENMMRTELVAVMEKTLAVRSRLMLRKASLKKLLTEINTLDPEKRFIEQQLFLRHVHVAQEQIGKMESALAELEKLRREKTAKILHTRKRRKTLERLRERHKTDYLKEQLRHEQNRLDDKTSQDFAQKITIAAT